MFFMKTDRSRIVVISLLLAAFIVYSVYLYAALPVKAEPAHSEADSGKLAWQQYNCNACHQVYGLGGYLGPDLTNVYSAKGSVYIQAFLKNGTTIMPNYQLTGREIRDLTAFLESIDASGKSDPKTFTRNYDGTIEQ
jgi:nitric oxide reductase subunit C